MEFMRKAINDSLHEKYVEFLEFFLTENLLGCYRTAHSTLCLLSLLLKTHGPFDNERYEIEAAISTWEDTISALKV